jgi:CRISPR system Cascade subunit CasC
LAKKGGELETAYPRKCQTYVLNLARADLSGFGTEKASLDAILEEALKTVQG